MVFGLAKLLIHSFTKIYVFVYRVISLAVRCVKRKLVKSSKSYILFVEFFHVFYESEVNVTIMEVNLIKTVN